MPVYMYARVQEITDGAPMTNEEMLWKAQALSREIALTEFIRRLLADPIMGPELPRIGVEMRTRGAMRHAAQDRALPPDLKDAYNNIADLLEGRIPG